MYRQSHCSAYAVCAFHILWGKKSSKIALKSPAQGVHLLHNSPTLKGLRYCSNLFTAITRCSAWSWQAKNPKLSRHTECPHIAKEQKQTNGQTRIASVLIKAITITLLIMDVIYGCLCIFNAALWLLKLSQQFLAKQLLVIYLVCEFYETETHKVLH